MWCIQRGSLVRYVSWVSMLRLCVHAQSERCQSRGGGGGGDNVRRVLRNCRRLTIDRQGGSMVPMVDRGGTREGSNGSRIHTSVDTKGLRKLWFVFVFLLKLVRPRQAAKTCAARSPVPLAFCVCVFFIL